MKWPQSLTLLRHWRSAYNILAAGKDTNPDYIAFRQAQEADPFSPETRELALAAKKALLLGVGDWQTPLDSSSGSEIVKTGKALREEGILPNVVLVSPYNRTLGTYDLLKEGWPELANVKVYKDERLRERENGLKLLTPDRLLFNTLYPEQAELYDLEGPYWYRPPQGENIPDVRVRTGSLLGTVIRDYAGEHVLMVSHHINILAMMAQIERWDAEMYQHVDSTEPPKNGSVTRFVCKPHLGRNGKLEREFYNRIYY